MAAGLPILIAAIISIHWRLSSHSNRERLLFFFGTRRQRLSAANELQSCQSQKLIFDKLKDTVEACNCENAMGSAVHR